MAKLSNRTATVGSKTLASVCALVLMTVCPIFVASIHQLVHNHNGSLLELGKAIHKGGIRYSAFPSPIHPIAVFIVLCFWAAALTLTKFLPGETFLGPPSPTGFRNTYKANGVLYYISFIALFLGGSNYGLGIYDAGVIYDWYGEILSSLTVGAFILCFVLYVKGHLRPSSDDAIHTRNPIYDFYVGVELYPNILGWDVKQMTNSRFGLMWWAISLISFAVKQKTLYQQISSSMMVSCSLQLIYLLKFYFWETGYLCTMDIQHDRAGFYICWGCLSWVPAVYTLAAHWSVQNPIDLPQGVTIGLIVAGIVAIMANYDADRQRQAARSTDGKLEIWGRPAKCIEAEYTDSAGKKRKSVLLASGWWGVSRHWHYIPEMVAALLWTPPVHLKAFAPYFYVVFLGILLFHRAFRDDERCSQKYGASWARYKAAVPYMLVPGWF